VRSYMVFGSFSSYKDMELFTRPLPSSNGVV
jgi:hypothetical protein